MKKVRASQVLNFPWLWTKPVTHKFMKAGPVFNNIPVQFEMWTNQGSDAHINWGAATASNALHEFRELADIEGINPPPMGLDILVARNSDLGYALMQPGQNLFSELTLITLTALSSATGPFSVVIGILGASMVQSYLPDVMIGINLQSSDRLKSTAFHELAHASHSTVVSGSYWRTLIDSEIVAILTNNGDPWGNAQSPGAGVIAVCESWAEHIGMTFTHRIYGVQNSVPDDWLLNLERTRNDDLNHVPIGLYHDLIDDTPDIVEACDRDPFVCGPINDQVSGFTNGQLFSLLNDDIFSPAAYRNRLLQISNPATHSAINNLFDSY
ncbi:MAG: hypothetical protein KF852_11050 [Saprospiraceae bacterium]|nr:hypothetical protein [Saprospiraceae bacterium]